MAVLLLADVVGGALATDQLAKALTAVKSLGPVTVLVAGPDAAAAAAEAATLAGVALVLLAEDETYAHGLSEPTAALVVSLAGDYEHIAAASGALSKSVLPRVAALLGWSQGTFASEVAIEGDHAKVTREVDGGLQTITVRMPTIITVDLRLNEPRYASLPNIMKAKAKPLATKTPADYGVDVSPRLSVVKTVEPAGRKAGVKVGSVAELIAKLKDEAGVL